MSTGKIKLDMLLSQIQEDIVTKSDQAVSEIQKRYPGLSFKEATEICSMITSVYTEQRDQASLVVTAPPSFAIKAKPTKVTVNQLLEKAENSILITGYSISDYVEDLIKCIIRKSQAGVFVRFYVNHIDNQDSFEKLVRYKGKFLKIYNYPEHQDDKMSALHAKVISIDQKETLITSANLSYHGHEGNIELGMHIVSEDIARQVDDVFTKLLFSKMFEEI